LTGPPFSVKYIQNIYNSSIKGSSVQAAAY
jgi:hypothetical protein